MKLLKTLFIGIASLALVSCGSIKTNSTTSPSEEWLVKCPKVVATAPADFAESQLLNNKLLDELTECRMRHNPWVDYERNKVK